MSDSARSPQDWQPWQMDPLGSQPAQAQDPQAGLRELQRRKAFEYKLDLQAQREKVLDQARQAGHAEGVEQGYAQGLSEGRQAAAVELQNQIQAALQPLRALCQNFEQALDQIDAHIAPQLARIALDTARQLVGQTLAAQPEQVIVMVRQLLAVHPELTGKPKLWLNPQDLQCVQQSLADDLAAAGWQLHADAGVSPGGCRVVSASGELDATCESRWNTLEQNAGRTLDTAVAALVEQP